MVAFKAHLLAVIGLSQSMPSIAEHLTTKSYSVVDIFPSGATPSHYSVVPFDYSSTVTVTLTTYVGTGGASTTETPTPTPSTSPSTNTAQTSTAIVIVPIRGTSTIDSAIPSGSYAPDYQGPRQGACDPLGEYNCIAPGTSFQQCASGQQWSVQLLLAEGTKCQVGLSSVLNVVPALKVKQRDDTTFQTLTTTPKPPLEDGPTVTIMTPGTVPYTTTRGPSAHFGNDDPPVGITPGTLMVPTADVAAASSHPSISTIAYPPSWHDIRKGPCEPLGVYSCLWNRSRRHWGYQQCAAGNVWSIPIWLMEGTECRPGDFTKPDGVQ
ncbi:hypothetical protein QBC35DRAFT_455628 [Podospora australis]|uniref:Carbohydrate-binding module family 19 domain-containing protein n=1 Tax=Podospora australis TaxID=1536484 RepID=A0AAN6WMN0_9PEZI|nr:hypothetical protein QBC35DRAFT_455628 [Podospora australis]